MRLRGGATLAVSRRLATDVREGAGGGPLLCLVAGAAGASGAAAPPTPAELYGELFERVQL